MSQDETAAQHNAIVAGLADAALAAARGAYRPYSGLGVGAAARAVGLTLCAECSLVSDLYRTGGGRLLELVVVSHTGDPLAPCGRCRQLLHEHGGPGLVVHTARGAVPLAELLPDAFGPGDLR